MDNDLRDSSACTVCGSEADLESLLWINAGSCPHCDDHPPFLRKTVEGVIVLTFLPNLPWKSEVQCLEALTATIKAGVHLVFNLSCVTVPSSLLLGVLISARRKIRAAGGTLRLCGLCPAAAEVLRTMHLQNLFDIYPDEPTAIGAPYPMEVHPCTSPPSR